MRLRAVGTVGAFALFFAVWLATLRWQAVSAMDLSVSEWFRGYGLAHPGWITFLRTITRGAGGIELLGVGVLGVVVLLATRRYRDCALVVCGLSAVDLLLPLTQNVIDRARPVDGFVFIPVPSFPSGHTMFSATESMIVVLVLWRYFSRRARYGLVALAVTWTVVIAVSRVGLLAHWPTDVVGGWLLTAGVLLTVESCVRVVFTRRPVSAKEQPIAADAARRGSG